MALSGASTVVVAGARPSWAEAASTVPETFVTVDLDALATAASAPLTPADRPVALRAGHPVYTLFTSGSTGQPKGVTVTHRGLHDMLSWFGAYTGDPADERVLVKTPYTFDASVWELFWPFVAGATLVVARPDGHRDPGERQREQRQDPGDAEPGERARRGAEAHDQPHADDDQQRTDHHDPAERCRFSVGCSRGEDWRDDREAGT